MAGLLKRILLGRSKDVRDPGIFHRMALIPFLAWVGLGADGLSSSAYGPEESFRALGQHTYLAVALAVATALTILVISAAYSGIIEQFPAGGGGYVVATKLLGERAGVVAGAALWVDYVLTITVSVASGADAIFSFLPAAWLDKKLLVIAGVLVLLTLINLRGVKESVVALTPIFIVFLITHAVLILGGLLINLGNISTTTQQLNQDFHQGLATLGWGGMTLLFFRAYSMGSGTYTGIEAVSNGLPLLREPRVENGKRTMVYMSISLAITAGGIMVAYLLLKVSPVEGKTMNAVLAETLSSTWQLGPVPIGKIFVITLLIAEGLILFVAAQAGFIGGPRVIANMAADSWLPHRLAQLSDRLTTQNGVLVMGGAALLALFYTGGKVSTLLVMYSINVFVTFLLSMVGMIRLWWRQRREGAAWRRPMATFVTGSVMCLVILAIVVYEKFTEGGWVTIVVTSAGVALCLLIRHHYHSVERALGKLDRLFDELPIDPKREELGPCLPEKPTAAIFVGRYGGVGVHTLLTLLKMFPGQFTNAVFISIGVIDTGNFKGAREMNRLRKQTEVELGRYVGLARRLGLSAEFRCLVGPDVVAGSQELADQVAREFPRTVFFSASLIFESRLWYHRFLHNETGNAIQHRLQFAGHPMVILPVRVLEKELEDEK